jgi:hypothetical protein
MATISQYIETCAFGSISTPDDGTNIHIVVRNTDNRIVAEIQLTHEEAMMFAKRLNKFLKGVSKMEE